RCGRAVRGLFRVWPLLHGADSWVARHKRPAAGLLLVRLHALCILDEFMGLSCLHHIAELESSRPRAALNGDRNCIRTSSGLSSKLAWDKHNLIVEHERGAARGEPGNIGHGRSSLR